ncbi:MAG TPA: caspase family protein [Rhizobiales bacterium]|nr:caspase family protein [Hyphomicrobiales bacterium]
MSDAPDRAEPRRAPPNQLLTGEIPVVQQCLKEAGYLRAPVRESMGKKAWTAFWFFKQDYSVGRTPEGVYNPKAQHKLFTLCPKTSSQLALLPARIAPPADVPRSGVPLERSRNQPKPQQPVASLPAPAEIKPAPEVKSPVKRVYARPEAGCLPSDLHTLIVGTYGRRPNLKKCTQTCIAMPANITRKEIKEYESKRGIRWCRDCIELSTQLPLEEILRLERGANVQVCTRPPSRLLKWSGLAASGRGAYTRVRALYTPFPPGTDHDADIAVVIGNRTYQNGLPVNASASASAGALYAVLTEHLGYRQENVIDLRDASLKQLTKVFGSKEDHKGDLWRRVQSQPGARVLIYYAGHAGTRSDQSDSYLLPVDAVKYREERASYAMSLLYANLEKLGAKSVLLLLEAGFGRDLSDFVFPPNLPGMQVSALPAKPVPGLTVLSASDRDQKTLDDPKYGIGLFTRYLIEGLAGRADLEPIGNRDRAIDAVELYAYTSHMVRLAARKSFGLLQKPTISQQGNLRITRVQAQGQ